MKKAGKRLVLETLGWILVIGGIAALVLPGPGLLGIFAGLALLSQQYDWAEKRVEPVKEKALKAAEEGVETNLRMTVSIAAAVGIIACGVLWIWGPPAPGWWPVDEKWWLFGGAGTGITQVVSGFIAIALIVYSYRRFRMGKSHAEAAGVAAGD
jgi:hypothetical protein